MKHPQKAWVFAVFVVMCAAGLAAGAAQQYTFSTAGNVPAAFSTTIPLAVNLTQIVGYYTAPSVSSAYIQTGFRFITRAPKGAVSSYLSGVNNRGLAVGGWCTGQGCSFPTAQHGYTYNSTTGRVTTFDVTFAGQTTVAYGINDFGEIVGGYCQGPSGCPGGIGGLAPTHGFLLSSGQYTTLDYPNPRVTGTSCNAINDTGTIVGWYTTDNTENGFIYQNGTYSLLDFPGATSTFPNGINNSGVVAGDFQNADGSTHGFTYQNGAFTQVDVPPQRGFDAGITGINDAGALVGLYVDFTDSLQNFKAVPKHSAP